MHHDVNYLVSPCYVYFKEFGSFLLEFLIQLSNVQQLQACVQHVMDVYNGPCIRTYVCSHSVHVLVRNDTTMDIDYGYDYGQFFHTQHI